MYEQFFGFEERPFSHTPNTKFLFLSDQHEAAMKTLLYGIQSRCGFLVLTGEVGSGKTTTVRGLLNILSDNVETSYIFNPLLTTLDIVRSINRDFGNLCLADSCQLQLETLNHYLLKISTEGKTAVVIIDEAQNLSFESLEMTRMLTNLETESQKLLNIILVGQPELEEKLARTELRQLAQRIQVHARLKPLSLPQTAGYIEHRLQKSGPRMAAHFEQKAIKRIHKTSHGVPRLINRLCDLGLLAAYCENTRVVDEKIIKKALKEVPRYVTHS